MKIFVKSNSAISGFYEGYYDVGDETAFIPWDADIIRAFLADDDLQEMTICSANIGFVKTLRKDPR